MSYTNGKHFTARFRRSVRVARGAARTSLATGVFAALLAVVVAVTAVAALAAGDSGIKAKAEATTGATPVTGNVYASDVEYSVAVTVPEGKALVTDTAKTYVTGDAVTQGTWSDGVANDDGTTTHTMTVTVGEATNVELGVHVTYTEGEDAAEKTDDVSTGATVTVDTKAPSIDGITMNQRAIGVEESDDGSATADVYGEDGLTATVDVSDDNLSSVTINGEEMGTSGSYKVNCAKIHEITVTATDAANHSVTKTYGDFNANSTFLVDTEVPAIVFSVDGAEVSGTVYYTGATTVTATVTSDKKLASVEGLDGWTLEDGATDTKKVYTKEIKEISADEDISVTATKANGKDGSNKLTVVIDNEAPVFSVELSGTPYKDNYYAAKRELTITVTDANLDSESPLKVTDNGSDLDVSWSKDGTTYTGTATLADGNHCIEVSGQDLAGNTAKMSDGSETYNSGDFVVDTVAPSVSISSNENKKWFSYKTTATVTIDEANWDESKITVETTGKEGSWQYKNGVYELTVTFYRSGENTIKVSGCDKAGNPVGGTTEWSGGTSDFDAPTVKVEWSGAEAVTTKESTSYFAGSRTATLTVTEANFELSDDLADYIHVFTKANSEASCKWTQNEDGTWSTTVEMSEEDSYEFRVTGKDKAGNDLVAKDGSSLTESFVIDTTAPVFTVSFADGDECANKNGDVAYYGAARTATITVTEKNFEANLMNVTDADGNKIDVSWSSNDDVHTATVSYTSDGMYELEVSGTDLAGWKALLNGETDATSYDSGVFVVDKTAPTVSIALDQPLVQTFDGADYFNLAPTATVTVKDANLKTAASSVAFEGGSLVEDWTAGSIDENGAVEWTAKVAFTEGTGRTLSVTATDWAKNTAEVDYGVNTTDSANEPLTSATFDVDLTAPAVTSANVSNNPSNSYANSEAGDLYFFNAQTRLTVCVEDAIGIKSVALAQNDSYVGATSLTSGDTAGTLTVDFRDGASYTRSVNLITIDLAENNRYWNIGPDGTVTELTQEQYAKNVKIDETPTYASELLQDTVYPVVSLSGVTEGSFYNATQTVSLSVTELNIPYVKAYDGSQVVFTATKTEGNAGRAQSSWTRPVTALSGSDSSWSLSEDFADDGHYVIDAQVTDPAGNSASTHLGEFTIDKTAPVVDVQFDNNDVANGKYYKAARTATITVTEHNFDASLIGVTTNGVVGSWSSSGDTHTLTVSFAADGTYNLSVEGSDQAGNAMETYTADEFVVDLTDPKVTIGGVEGDHAYNGEVMPTITYEEEANFNASACTYVLTGTKNGEVVYEASAADSALSRVVSYLNFVDDPDFDDIYTLTAHMTDLAGNEANDSLTFSVNRYGSTFRLVNEDEFKTSGGYVVEAPEVLIEEINVCGDDAHKPDEDGSDYVDYDVRDQRHVLTVTRGTEVTELELNETAQSTGYTISEGSSTNSDSNGWVVYTYRVASGNFSKDGSYHLSVTSDDRATNVNSSSSYYERATRTSDAEAKVDFVLDETAPVIQNLSISDGAVYDTNVYEGSFTVVEDIGLKEVTVEVDGQQVEATADSTGMNFTFEVESAAFTTRSVSVVATDLAGHEGSANASDFRVTTNIFELHLLWVIIGVLVVAGVIALVLLAKRKKDKDARQAA